MVHILAKPLRGKATAKGRQAKQNVQKNSISSYTNVAWKSILLKAKRAAECSRSIIRRYRVSTRILGALVISAPPYMIGQYYQVDKFAAQIKNDWPLPSAFLDHHEVVGILSAGVWTFVMLAIYRLLADLVRERPGGWSDAPLMLLQTLDNIVGAKEQRFSDHLKSIRNTNNGISPGDVFSFITKPDQQLNELIRGIYSTVDSLLKMQGLSKYVLKVNLAAIQNKSVADIYFHYPNNHPVRSNLTALNNPKSTIMNAVRSHRIVVLESIAIESVKPKPKFFVSDVSREGEDGALICYPVLYDPLGEVIFVVSIHVDQPGTFQTKFVNSYIELLKPFALRIKLEYALLALKELTV